MPATITAAASPSFTAAPDVAELLEGVVRRDPSAWAEIMRRYGRLVLARARSFRLQEADVADAVQITWLRLAESCHTVRYPERLGGWLVTTVSRECLLILRRGRKVVHDADVVENQTDPAAGPEQRAVDAETAGILRSVVAELPARRRSLLEAFIEDDPPPYAELSSRIGMPIGSIGPTRARSLRQLRILLEERGLAPSA